MFATDPRPASGLRSTPEFRDRGRRVVLPDRGVAATTVQTATAEVDSEKLAKASNLSDVASQASAFTNLVGPGGTVTGDMTFSGAKVNRPRVPMSRRRERSIWIPPPGTWWT